MRLSSVVLTLAVTSLASLAGPARADDAADAAYLAPHPDARWWLSGQANFILQAQPGFHSPYEGPNSLRPDDHAELSFVATVFGGFAVTSTTAVVVTGESAGGNGLSSALGIAGFTNLDVVRNPTLGPTPYIGRAFVEQVIPLGGGAWTPEDRGPLHALRRVAPRRIEIRAGKMSLVDELDQNEGASDSHLQFMNWSVDNNGAFDYAADTRGYTLGAVVEYIDPRWGVLRYGIFLMPTVANGINYDYDLANARGENLELELHETLGGHPGIVRLLGFLNHAAMGDYDEAIAEYHQGLVSTPDVTATRLAGRVKYGFGANVEQELPRGVHVFGRVGWNEGQHESFAYTEIDNTAMVGADWQPCACWKLGAAFVTNGISVPHRTYLALGGLGFLLGDGRLHYGREDIVEAYATWRAYRGVFPAADVQVIANPGYNTDRGPVVVGSLRLHVEI